MTTASSSTPLLDFALSGGEISSYLWRSGAILVSIGVVTGAFGAHGLERKAGITPRELYGWEKASNYAVANGLGLMLVSLHPKSSGHHFAGPAILVGGVLFSGSIFGLVLKRYKFLGPITPLGGIIMIAGYLSLGIL